MLIRQSKLIEAAIASQRSIKEDNLRRRYVHYPRIPKLRLPQPPHDGDDNQSDDNHNSVVISHILTNLAPPHPPILSAVKLILHRNPITGVDEFIKVFQSNKSILFRKSISRLIFIRHTKAMTMFSLCILSDDIQGAFLNADFTPIQLILLHI